MLRLVKISLPRCPLCKQALSPGVFFDEEAGRFKVGWSCECPVEEVLEFLEDLGLEISYQGTHLAPSQDQ